jgi:hypothetical protein
VDKLFGHLPFAACYVDDIVVFSKSLEEHDDHLHQVFRILQSDDLHVALEKVSLCRERINDVGFIIGQGTVSPDTAKPAAIANTLPPTTKSELLSFLGACNWLRMFVPKFATLAAPLSDFPHSSPSHPHTKRGPLFL